MGKVSRLSCHLNLLLPCFGLFATPDLACQPGITPPPYTKYVRSQADCTVVESWFNSQQRGVGPPPFPICMIFIYDVNCRVRYKCLKSL